MTFFDISPYSLPEDSKYFFNILVTCIALSPSMAEECFQKDIVSVWELENITNSRPQVYHIYIDEYASCDVQVTSFPHCVVELRENNEVSFFQMLDYDIEDNWRID